MSLVGPGPAPLWLPTPPARGWGSRGGGGTAVREGGCPRVVRQSAKSPCTFPFRVVTIRGSRPVFPPGSPRPQSEGQLSRGEGRGAGVDGAGVCGKRRRGYTGAGVGGAFPLRTDQRARLIPPESGQMGGKKTFPGQHPCKLAREAGTASSLKAGPGWS